MKALRTNNIDEKAFGTEPVWNDNQNGSAKEAAAAYNAASKKYHGEFSHDGADR